jgi:hypothetical protein
MNNTALVGYGFVMGVVLAGTVGWLAAQWLLEERDRYRELFLRAAGEIERARRKK